MRRVLLFACTCITLVVLTASAQSLGSQVSSIEELRALAAGRSSRVGALKLSLDCYQDPPASRRGGSLIHIFRTVLVDAVTGRFSIDRQARIEGAGDGDGEFQSTHSFDGEVEQVFVPEHMPGVVQEGTNTDGTVESGIWGVLLPAPPQPEGHGIDDGSLESLLARGAVRPELETVGGRLCHVVDASADGVRYATVWLDVERDLLPMKRVGYDREGIGSTILEVDSVELLEREQVWIPTSWHLEFKAGNETLRSRTVVDAKSVELDPPVTDEDFHPDFPPGTIVSDQISGLTYRVSEDGGIGEVIYERQGDQWVSA